MLVVCWERPRKCIGGEVHILLRYGRTFRIEWEEVAGRVVFVAAADIYVGQTLVDLMLRDNLAIDMSRI